MVKPIETTRLKTVIKAGHHRTAVKGEVLRTSEDSESFYYVDKGFVKRYLITNDGHIDIQSIYGKGFFFPLITVYSGFFQQEVYRGPETYYYEAMAPTELYYVDIKILEKASETDPLIYRELLAIAGRRIEANIQQLENRSLRSSYKRVAHQLLFFAKQFGIETRSGIRINLALTHQDLADTLSVTRETVSQSMVKLAKAGLIKTGRHIVVPNYKKLQTVAFS